MSKTSNALRLGTRGSALALWQARWTRSELESLLSGMRVEVLPIRTTGDRIQNVSLSQVGGKGLFTKELDEALLDGRIDLAVHSLKDLPFHLPPGVALAAVTRREDPRDAFVSNRASCLDRLASGARVGTSSLRRQAQLRAAFPELRIDPLRGNVDTRLGKLDSGEFDGVILAAAGLIRLGLSDRISEFIDPDLMLPAIGQGALGMVCRASDEETAATLRLLEDPDTRIAVTAERAFMASLEGNCQVPIAGYARVESSQIDLKGLIASIDGRRIIFDSVSGPVSDADGLGKDLGRRLRLAGADAVLEELRTHGT